MDLWFTTQQYPDAPPFSGGVLDGWPAYAVDALAICRTEVTRIQRATQPEVKR